MSHQSNALIKHYRMHHLEYRMNLKYIEKESGFMDSFKKRRLCKQNILANVFK